jgi:hypothetical protein
LEMTDGVKAGRIWLESRVGIPESVAFCFMCGRPLWQGVFVEVRDRLLSYVRPVCAAEIFAPGPDGNPPVRFPISWRAVEAH